MAVMLFADAFYHASGDPFFFFILKNLHLNNGNK